MNRKPTKLDALFVFAMTSGLFLAVQIQTGMDISESGLGLMITENISNSLGNTYSFLIPLMSIVLPLANGAVTIHHVKTAIEHRHRGALISGGGFFGMFFLVLGSLAGMDFATFMGVGLCIVGGIVPRLHDNE